MLSPNQRHDLAAELAAILSDRPVPTEVGRYCRKLGIGAHQVRWCDWCGVIAFAIDHHQVALLDAVGFDTLCPECKCPDW